MVLLQIGTNGVTILGEAKLEAYWKPLEGDTLSLQKFVASNERGVQDSKFSHAQYIIMTGPLSEMPQKIRVLTKCLAPDYVTTCRKLPDGSWTPIKVDVKFYHIGNQGEDGVQRDINDSEGRTFYEGLTVQELDPRSGLPLDKGALPLPVKGASVRVQPGRPREWEGKVWSPKQPVNAVDSVKQQQVGSAATSSTAGQATEPTKKKRKLAQSSATAGTERSWSGEMGERVRSLLSGQATVEAAQAFENVCRATTSATVCPYQLCATLTASEEQRLHEFTTLCM